MNRITKLSSIAVLGVSLAASAHATFLIDPNPGGIGLNLDNVQNSASTTGLVGTDVINIETTDNADFASGQATITPATRTGELTQLVFTPEDGDLFSAFSFRGQLDEEADGTVRVIVQDNQGNAPQEFEFTGLGQNANFQRIGVYSLDGQTIQSVTLISVFRQQKQTEFGYATGNNVPDGGTTLALLGMGLLGLQALRRKLAF